MLHEIGRISTYETGTRRWQTGGMGGGAGPQMRKTGDPKAAACLCVMGDLNPQPAD